MLWRSAQLAMAFLGHGRVQIDPRRRTNRVPSSRWQVDRLEERCLLDIGISEIPFPANTLTSAAAEIALGSDGSLWFTAPNSDQIGRRDGDGEFSVFPLTAGSRPLGIAPGPDGALWFTQLNGNRIGRIDLDGNISEFALAAGSSPADITTGSDGALWFTQSQSSRIGRITVDGTLTEFALPANAQPNGITSGPDGALWFVQTAAGRIGRITTDGTLTEFNLAANSNPIDITPGLDGALWFTEQGKNRIGRITTAGALTEFVVPTANAALHDIVSGPDGNLWFTEGNSNQIGRITLLGRFAEFAIPTAGSNPDGIVVGADGALYFAENALLRLGKVTVAAAGNVVVGADAGGAGRVVVFDSNTQTKLFEITPYEAAFQGGVRVAAGDITGDGVADIITAPGSGRGPHVRVFDGLTGNAVPGDRGDFLAFDARFRGGVFVAAGDVNGDGIADIVTGAGSGIGPIVQVFDGNTGTLFDSASSRFFAYDASFRGGVRVATGDVNGDGIVEVITAPGSNSRGRSVDVRDASTGVILLSFVPFGPGFRGGVTVAAGDVNGDGFADIVVGADGSGAAPRVRVFSGLTGNVLHDFLAFDAAFTGGVRVATADVNGDGSHDMIVGGGPGAGTRTRVFDGVDAAVLDDFFSFGPAARGRKPAQPKFGVFVSGAVSPHPIVDDGLDRPCLAAVHNQCFVSQLYRDLLDRPVDRTSLKAATDLLDAGTSRGQIAQHILSSPEYLTNLVQKLYQQLLQRPAQAVELTHALAVLSAGGSHDQLKTAIVGSDEYFTSRGGSSNNGFLDALYRDLLGRPVDALGLATFNPRLASGVSRAGVASQILATDEAFQLILNQMHNEFLRRNPSAGEVTALVALLRAGASEEHVIAILVSSTEYFERRWLRP